MEVFNVLSRIFVTPITELCIPSLKRQIGYIYHCEENLKQLKEKVEELKGIRDIVQVRVDADLRNLRSIHEDVEGWLRKVESEISTTRDDDQNNILALVMNNDDDAVLNLIINKKCWCSAGGSSRYSLGKKAKNKLDTIEKLLIEGSGFTSNTISEPCGVTNPIPNKDFVSFASREDLMEQVMAALQNEGSYLIGVHGMGGAGKTTFVSQVYEQMKNDRNLFDDVVMVKNITKDVDLNKIQNEIAEGLGLEDIKKADSTLKRAEMLFERLKKNRTLVILDDLWSHLNFSEVGIPCGGSCNVIITTRRLEVCTSLGSQVNIKIDGLSEVDSWHLFKKMNVGDRAYTPDLENIAREIANECGGLPVALVVLAKGLKNKVMDVWKSTLHQLRISEIPDIEDIDSKVYTSIKLSYVHLTNPIFQKCFLLCSLFPHAHEIYIPDLMAYLIAGDDMMSEDEWTLEQMKFKVSTILAKLVDSSLLLREEGSDGPDLSSVSMHDVIRDVAINIASEEGNGFLVKAGRGLKRWPTKSLLSCTTGNGKFLRRLSLMKNEISSLPDEPPELPYLLSFSLYGNTSLKEIPNSFFEKMESLATLDLRKTGISLLPSSIAFLKNLKTLYLDGCEFNQPSDISVIGKLNKLEILSLANCGLLLGLPEELKELTNLRLLNVESSYSRGFTIPRNVIGSLSRLEYLNTENCKISWEFEGWGNGRNASLEEVLSLSGLRLELEDRTYRVIQYVDVSSENLMEVNKFSISFSDATGILMMSSNPKSRNSLSSSKCVVDVSPPVCHPIKVLIQRVEILRVFNGKLKSLGQLGGGFTNLKELDVQHCYEMEYLMSVEEAETGRPFVALEKLTLHKLYRLKAIFMGPIGWVDKLRDLDIENCGKIVSIFDPNLGIRSAPNLESLKVRSCSGLKDVFNLNNPNNMEEARLISNVVTFSRLRRMELWRLPILENIWKGHNNIPFGCFENLEEIEVSNCFKMRYLFSPSMARNLQNLKILKIYWCESMVKLISSIDQQMLIFPKLRILHIHDCENLKQLWEIEKNLENEDDDDASADEDDDVDADAANADDDDDDDDDVAAADADDQVVGRASILDFPALESLKVLGCKNLKRCTKQLKEFIGDRWCQRIEWEEPSDKLRLQSLFQQLESIPDMVQGVWSDNFELQLKFTTKFRKILSSENFDIIDNVIKACVVPRFVEFLERQDQPQLQYEAAWALTNFDDVSKQGCVVGGSPNFNEHSKLSMLRKATLTICEFCQGYVDSDSLLVEFVLLALGHLIHSTDEQVLTDACRGLFGLCVFNNNGIQAVIDAGVIPRLVDLLLHPSDKVVFHALRTKYKILTHQTQYLLDKKVIPCLYQLLTQNRHENIKKEACWTISRFTRGNRGQIQAVIEANIIPSLVHLLQHEEFEIKKAAAHAISNATSGGSSIIVHGCEQIEYLINQGCIKPLCDLLVYRDSDCMMVCLVGLENIMKLGEENKKFGKSNSVNIYAQMIEECKGLDKIRNLQNHDNREIKEKAVKILERYWWESILDMVQGVWSDNFELQLEFTTKFREFSSSENFDRINKVIKACVVTRFAEFLERQDQLQYEAAWALTNITSGTSEHTQVVINHDDAGGSPIFNEHSKLSMLRNATRTLCEYCEDRQPFEQVNKLVLLSLRHLIHSTDEQVLTDACSALYHLSDAPNYRIQAVIDAGVFPRLVDLLLHPSDTVVEHALGTMYYIVCRGNDAHTQYILDNQVLPCLYQLITQNHEENIKKYACLTISNITRSGRIQALIEANIFAPLVHLLQHAEFEIKKVAAEALSNATSGGSREQIEYLINQGCIKPLCDLLVYRDPDCMMMCLEGLENILSKNNGVNIYAQMIDECKGLDKIRNLLSHYDIDIKEKAVKILERYWWDMVQGVWSDNFELQIEFTTKFRKFSSENFDKIEVIKAFTTLFRENFDRIEEVIKACVVPRFVEFLERQDLPKLQYEAAWALTNITSGTSEHTQVVIDHDDAGGSPSFNEHSKLSMLRNATRTLSENCKGILPLEQVKLVLLALRHLIHSTNEQVLTDACWGLYHLSYRIFDKDIIQAMVDVGVIPLVVDLLLHPSDTIVLPALRTVNNILLWGNDAHTQYILDNQVLLPCLYQLLTQNHEENIKSLACWTISEITDGNRGWIQVVIEANIYPPLVHLLQHEEFKIKNWAARAISNATSGRSREQIEYLVNQGCIKPLCDLLVYRDFDCMKVCLEGLENILRAGEEDKKLGKNNGVNIYAQMIDECKGLDKIKNLQSHDNNKILKRIKRYWVEDEDEADDEDDDDDVEESLSAARVTAVPSVGDDDDEDDDEDDVHDAEESLSTARVTVDN